MLIRGWRYSVRFMAPEDGEGGGAGGAGGEGGGAGGAGGEGGGGTPAGILNGDKGGEAGGQGGGVPGIYEQMSPATRTALEAKGWASADDVAQAYLSLESKIGEKGLPIPKPDAPPERWAEFYNALGRPEAADKYDLPKPPEGIPADEKREAWFRESAHKHGLTQAQASAMYADFYENVKAQYGATKAAVDAANDGLKVKWGDRYKEKLSNADFAYGRAFGEEMRAAAEGIMTREGIPITAHPLIVEGFAALGEMLAEGGQGPANLFGPGGGLISTPADAQREISRMKADEETGKALLDAKHPEHKEVVEKMTRLNHIIRSAGVPG